MILTTHFRPNLSPSSTNTDAVEDKRSPNINDDQAKLNSASSLVRHTDKNLKDLNRLAPTPLHESVSPSATTAKPQKRYPWLPSEPGKFAPNPNRLLMQGKSLANRCYTQNVERLYNHLSLSLQFVKTNNAATLAALANSGAVAGGDPEAPYSALTPRILKSVLWRISQYLGSNDVNTVSQFLNKFWWMVRQFTDQDGGGEMPLTVRSILAEEFQLSDERSALRLALDTPRIVALFKQIPMRQGNLDDKDIRCQHFVDQLALQFLDLVRMPSKTELQQQEVRLQQCAEHLHQAITAHSQALMAWALETLKSNARPDGSVPKEVFKVAQSEFKKFAAWRKKVIKESLDELQFDLGATVGYTPRSFMLFRQSQQEYFRRLIIETAQVSTFLGLAFTPLQFADPAVKAAFVPLKALVTLVASSMAQELPTTTTQLSPYFKFGALKEPVPNYNVYEEYTERIYGKTAMQIAALALESLPQQMHVAKTKFKDLMQTFGHWGPAHWRALCLLRRSETGGFQATAEQSLLGKPDDMSLQQMKEDALQYLVEHQKTLAQLPKDIQPADLLRTALNPARTPSGSRRLSVETLLHMLAQSSLDLRPDERHGMVVLGGPSMTPIVLEMRKHCEGLLGRSENTLPSDYALDAIRQALYAYQAGTCLVSCFMAPLSSLGISAALSTGGPAAAFGAAVGFVLLTHLINHFVRDTATLMWMRNLQNSAALLALINRMQQVGKTTAGKVEPIAQKIAKPTQQRDQLLTRVVTHSVYPLLREMTRASRHMGTQVMYALQRKYDPLGEPTIVGHLAQLSGHVRDQSAHKATTKYAKQVQDKAHQLETLAAVAGQTEAADGFMQNKRIKQHTDKEAALAHTQDGRAEHQLELAQAYFRELVEQRLADAQDRERPAFSQREWDHVLNFFLAPHATAQTQEWLQQVRQKMAQPGVVLAGDAPLHLDDPTLFTQKVSQEARQIWARECRHFDKWHRNLDALLRNWMFHLSNQPEKFYGKWGALLQSAITDPPDDLATRLRVILHSSDMYGSRAGAKLMSNTFGSWTTAAVFLSGLLGTVVDASLIATNLTVNLGTLYADSKPVKLDFLSMVPAALPQLASVLPFSEGWSNAAAQFGAGNLCVATRLTGSEPTVQVFYVLWDAASQRALALPEPTDPMLKNHLDQLREGLKSVLINPHTVVFNLDSPFEKMLARNFSIYHKPLALARTNTTHRPLRDWLKQVFDLPGIVKLLERLHHDESNDALVAEMTLALTAEYLAQLTDEPDALDPQLVESIKVKIRKMLSAKLNKFGETADRIITDAGTTVPLLRTNGTSGTNRRPKLLERLTSILKPTAQIVPNTFDPLEQSILQLLPHYLETADLAKQPLRSTSSTNGASGATASELPPQSLLFAAPSANTYPFATNLHRLGLRTRHSVTNGDCLFDALAAGHERTPEALQRMRQKLGEETARTPDSPAQSSANAESIANYLYQCHPRIYSRINRFPQQVPNAVRASLESIPGVYMAPESLIAYCRMQDRDRTGPPTVVTVLSSDDGTMLRFSAKGVQKLRMRHLKSDEIDARIDEAMHESSALLLLSNAHFDRVQF